MVDMSLLSGVAIIENKMLGYGQAFFDSHNRTLHVNSLYSFVFRSFGVTEESVSNCCKIAVQRLYAIIETNADIIKSEGFLSTSYKKCIDPSFFYKTVPPLENEGDNQNNCL